MDFQPYQVLSGQEAADLLSTFNNSFKKRIYNIKILNQKERVFILNVIRKTNNPTDSITYDNETENGVTYKANSPSFTRKPSNFLISFIKGIANRFFGRISSTMVNKALNGENVEYFASNSSGNSQLFQTKKRVQT